MKWIGKPGEVARLVASVASDQLSTGGAYDISSGRATYLSPSTEMMKTRSHVCLELTVNCFALSAMALSPRGGVLARLRWDLETAGRAPIESFSKQMRGIRAH